MSTKRAVLLALLAGLIAWAVTQVIGMPALYQYAAAMPAPVSEDGAGAGDAEDGEEQDNERERPSPMAAHMKRLKDLMDGQDDARSAWSVTSYASGASLGEEEGNAVTARLCGLYGDFYIHPAPVILSGRRHYQEELDQGRPVAVVDEKLAIELFRVSDPVGRTLQANGVTYEVIGVVAHQRTPGERDAISAYVPLTSLGGSGTAGQVLVASFQPQHGAGTFSALSAAMQQWLPGGTMYSLPKEMYRALLPLRYLCVFAACFMLGLLWRCALRVSRRLIAHARRRLAARYAVSLLPLFVGSGLLMALMYGALLAGAFLTFQEAVAPVYTFPEWVPAVPVEWTEISKTFWNNVSEQTGLAAMRTPEALTLAFWRHVLLAACALVGYLLIPPLLKLRNLCLGGSSGRP